ncbi:unnamed protein product, partial [Urochloa humidicola]
STGRRKWRAGRAREGERKRESPRPRRPLQPAVSSNPFPASACAFDLAETSDLKLKGVGEEIFSGSSMEVNC